MKIKSENEKAHVISKKRVTAYGEVYTRKREVNAMLDLVKQETERIDSRFLEPACGTGNFLVEILKRKLIEVERRYKRSQFEYEMYSLIAVSSLYGIDLLEDNIHECRNRLFNIFNEKYTDIFKNNAKDALRDSIKRILDLNIIQGDALHFITVGHNPQPIVFSEWSPVNGSKIKRRDFSFEELIMYGEESVQTTFFKESKQMSMFSDLGDRCFIPKPIKDFSPIHFLKLGDLDEN